MNADELRARLKSLGIPVNQWTETEERSNVVPPTIKRQKKALQQLAVLVGHTVSWIRLQISLLTILEMLRLIGA
mgnify:CR=1 FL=1